MNGSLRNGLLALAALIGACAYTGGGETGTGAAPTETTTTGVITGFGSIFVGGVEYFTDDATVDLDGRPGSEGELAVGMVVTLEGLVNPDGATGQARRVIYRKNLKGPVQANTIPAGSEAGTLTVLGQTITVDPLTVFEGDASTPTIDALATGQTVEISGFTTPDGIYATRVAVSADAGDEVEIKGRVSNLTATTFQLGALTVDFQGASLDFTLAEGQVVEVKGTIAADGTLTALEIDQEDHLPGELRGTAGMEGELEGIVVAVDADTGEIIVNGQTVRIPPHMAAQLAPGQRIELEGRFDEQGILVGETVQARPMARETQAQIQAPIEALDPTAGTLTLLGATYRVTASTILETGLGDLNPDDWVELKLFAEGDGWTIARLERKDADSEWEVEGRVSAVSGNTIAIAGLSLTLDTASLPPRDSFVRLTAPSASGPWSWEAESNGEKPGGPPGEGDADGEAPSHGQDPDDPGNDPDDPGNDPDDPGNDPDDSGNDPDDSGNGPDDSGNGPDDSGNGPDDSGNGPNGPGNGPHDSDGGGSDE